MQINAWQAVYICYNFISEHSEYLEYTCLRNGFSSDNSLHYFLSALDLLMVLLVCFLVAKLSDTNLLVFKKEKQPQSMF